MRSQPFIFKLPADIDKRARAIAFPQYELPSVVLITGGCGFLGRNLIDALLTQKSVRSVIAFDIVEGKFTDPRVLMVKGDLREPAFLAALKRHAVGAILHTASPHPNGTNKKVFYDVNVDGTKAVLAAALAAGVRTFVNTSSASVVWEGMDHAGVDESLPYPRVYRDYYAQTKALGEQAAMAFGTAHADAITTISLRPHAIFGPQDRQMVPTLIERAKEGKDKWVVGDGRNTVDFTYIGNVVHAHLLALQTGHRYWSKAGARPPCAANGKTYFITNGEPRLFWEVLNSFTQGLGYRGGYMRLPARLLKIVAGVQQALGDAYTAVMGGKPLDLTLSVPRIEIISTVHWYSVAAAKADLGYTALWPMEEGIYLTLRSFPELRNTDPPADVVERARKAGLVALGLVADTTTRVVKKSLAAVDVATLPEYTAAQVAAHATEGDMWVSIRGLVYNLTEYVPLHPCGIADIMQHPGGDASAGFHGPQHPESVHAVLAKFIVGRLKA